MLMDATSLTMMPILSPSLLVRRFCKVDVFPLPRKPASRVMGTGLDPTSELASASTSAVLVENSGDLCETVLLFSCLMKGLGPGRGLAFTCGRRGNVREFMVAPRLGIAMAERVRGLKPRTTRDESIDNIDAERIIRRAAVIMTDLNLLPGLLAFPK